MAEADTSTEAGSDTEEGTLREEDETAEDYKDRIVRYFADKYPNTDEGNAAFDKLDGDVTDWVDSATEIKRNNRGSRNKKRLPELDGLEEDEEKSKRAGRGEKKERAAKEPKAPKEKKEREGRDPEANRYHKIANVLAKHPTMTLDALQAAAKDTGYSERSIKVVHIAWTNIYDVMKKAGMLAA